MFVIFKLKMICKICKSEKNKAFFTKNQLKKKKDERICKDCSEKNNPNTLFTLDKQKVLFSDLIKWLLENGAEFPNLEIKHYNETFRGIVTNKNVKRGAEILKIPHSCIMTTLKAQECEAGLELKKSGWEPSSSHTWLSLFLLQEKLNKNSFWKPFIDILPPTYGDFPQFYNQSELKKLKGSFILDMIKSRNLNLEREFNELILHIPVFGKKINLRDYIWARIAIVSRVFQIVYSDVKKTQGLVPMADMLNHSKTPGTKWSFINDKDSFIIASDKFHIKGGEIFDTYGPKCNSRYLVNYGFTLKDNHVNNQAAIFIDPGKLLTEGDGSEKRKLELLTNNATTVDDSFCEYRFLIQNNKETRISQDHQFRFQFTKLLNREVQKRGIPIGGFTGLHSAWCLFGFMRILLSSPEEFTKLVVEINERMRDTTRLDFSEVLLNIDPLSPETEVKVLKTISDHCEQVLDSFPSLMESDEKELENTEPYSNDWNILNMIIGEKKVLLYYRELGMEVFNLWDKYKSINKVSRYLRKHSIYSIYYNVYWSTLGSDNLE